MRWIHIEYCKAIHRAAPVWWDDEHFNLKKISLTLLLHMSPKYKSGILPKNYCNPNLFLELRFKMIFIISILYPLTPVITFSGCGLKICKEVYPVTTQTRDDKSKETKRGNELFSVHMEIWLVFRNILFQMRKLNHNENLIQFPVGREMTGPSLWMEKWRKQGDDSSNVITIN